MPESFCGGYTPLVLRKEHGFVTQIQFFRARFDSDAIGYVLFPILVLLVIPYLLIGIIGAGKTIEPVTAGAFPKSSQTQLVQLGSEVFRLGCRDS